MKLTAQQRFNLALDERRETYTAVNEFVTASQANYGSYAYAAGSLTIMVDELIAQLPRAQRAQYRQRLFDMAQQQKNEHLVKVMKEPQ